VFQIPKIEVRLVDRQSGSSAGRLRRIKAKLQAAAQIAEMVKSLASRILIVNAMLRQQSNAAASREENRLRRVLVF
jgi:hypothetical protein